MNNVYYSIIVQFARVVSQFVGVIFIAKEIGIDSFGVVAAASIFINFSYLIKESGINILAIKNINSTNELKTINFYSLLIGAAILFFMTFFSMGLGFFGDSRIAWLVFCIAPMFLVSSIYLVPQVMVEVQDSFRFSAFSEASALFASVVIGVFSAKYGLKEFSFAVQYNSFAIILLLQFLFFRREYFICYNVNFVNLKNYYSFSFGVISAGFMNYATRNLDVVVISSVFGGGIAGIYSMATKFVFLPVKNITSIFNKSYLPVFCSKKNISFEEVSSVANKFSMFVLGLMSVIFIFIEDIVHLLLGQDWADVSLVVRLLVVAAYMQSLLSFYGVFIISRGDALFLRRLAAAGFIFYAIGYLFSSFFEYKYMMLSIVFSSVVNFLFAIREIRKKFLVGKIRVSFWHVLLTILWIGGAFLSVYVDASLLCRVIIIGSIGAITSFWCFGNDKLFK